MKFKQRVLSSIVALGVVASSIFISNAATQNLEVHFINVGQGDATYIELPDGTDILIDAGEGAYGNTVVQYLKNQEKGIDIEHLIVTHPDSDHVGGMQKVFTDLKVKNFYYPIDATNNTTTWKNVLNLAKKEGCRVLNAKPGHSINAGGTVVKFIQPTTDYKNTNDDSVVTLVDYKDTEILLTGDISQITENEMIKKNLLMDVDVLKVAHHGSSSSSTKAFLNKVKPENAIISVGKNSYGHPKADAVNRLINAKAKVWRTDKNGNIVVSTNGNTTSIKATGKPITTTVSNTTNTTNNNNTSRTVYANGGASKSNKYHKTATAHGMKGAIKMSEANAKKKGYVACKTCYR